MKKTLTILVLIPVLILFSSSHLIPQEIPRFPSETTQQELWHYALELGSGAQDLKRPSIRLVKLSKGAAYADLKSEEVHLHPVYAFSGAPHIVELYLAHEYLHFVLFHRGIPAKFHHCWMARRRFELRMTRHFLDRVKESRRLRRALLSHASAISRKWQSQCMINGDWRHALVSGMDMSHLAN